jgi:hypothetical protein
MEETTWWCPGGDGQLVASMDNGLHETCPACHGFAVTIWLLDELLVDGAGGAVWRASATADRDGDPCPSCRKPMAMVTGPGDAAVQVCRGCEVVWVDVDAQKRLPARAELKSDPALADSNGTGSAMPTECPNCGAPYEPNLDGRCTYCRHPMRVQGPSVSAPELDAEDLASSAAARADTSAQPPIGPPVADWLFGPR